MNIEHFSTNGNVKLQIIYSQDEVLLFTHTKHTEQWAVTTSQDFHKTKQLVLSNNLGKNKLCTVKITFKA